MNIEPVVVVIERPEGYEDVCDELVAEDAIKEGFCYGVLPHRPSMDALIPSAETFRLHLGELSENELRVARAAYRFALAVNTDPRQ